MTNLVEKYRFHRESVNIDTSINKPLLLCMYNVKLVREKEIVMKLSIQSESVEPKFPIFRDLIVGDWFEYCEIKYMKTGGYTGAGSLNAINFACSDSPEPVPFDGNEIVRVAKSATIKLEF